MWEPVHHHRGVVQFASRPDGLTAVQSIPSRGRPSQYSVCEYKGNTNPGGDAQLPERAIT